MPASPLRNHSSFWSDLSIRYKGAVVVAIPCACLLLALVFFTLLNREQQAATSWTLHSQQVRLEASRLLAALVDAETGQRGYLLTHQETFLEPYERGRAVVPESLSALRHLVSDNPAQLKRLDAIASLAKERLERMQATLKPAESAEMAARMTRSKQVMDELRDRINEFEAGEASLEVARRERLQREQTWFQWGLGLTSALALAGGVLAAFLFSSGISQRLKTLEAGAGEMAEGGTAPWPLSGGDEISHLARQLQSAATAIAERQKAEEELKRFFSISMDLLCVAGMDGYFKLLNPRWEKILGYSQQELLSRPYLEFIHPEDRAATIQTAATQAEGHEVISFENRYRCRDGSYRWFNWTATAVTERGLIYAAARDVTERKQNERRIREGEERFRLLVEGVKEYAIITLDPTGHVVSWNAGAEAIKGYSAAEIIGRHFSCFYPEEDRASGKPEKELKLLAAQGRLEDEGWRVRKDGSRFWANVVLTALRDDEGKLKGFSKVTRDLTARKRAEEELLAINQELEAFTYSVSHDLRAPLRHISGFSKLLAEEYGPALGATAQRYLERIQNGTRQMGLLVDDLLNLARIGRQELRMQATGLNSLLEDVLADLKPEADGRQVEWRVGRLPFVECDPALMKQVLYNLASNALKYTRPREKAVIEVSSIMQDGAAVIVFRDNGVGFSMKYADKLFGVFQRLHRPEDFEGTGIGLATVQRILHKHGGRAWAEAELDKGATFYFTLEPAEQKQSQDKSRTGGAVTHDGASG